MLDREKAVEKISQQLSSASTRQGKVAWHYGYVELRELLDVIYGGPPTKPSEELNQD